MTASTNGRASDSKASTVPSSATKDSAEVRSLSDRLMPSLISAGLVAGITPTSIRRGSGQGWLDLAFSPQVGATSESVDGEHEPSQDC